MKIEFGTDGWRAVIAEGFTFDSVKIVARAMGVAARAMDSPREVSSNLLVVGYDRRFLSREFALVVADELAASGFEVVLSNAATPSQTVSHAVRFKRAAGGVVVTASHNPAIYNGLKFKGWYGGSALPGIYDSIVSALGTSEDRAGGAVRETDILADYLAAIRARLDVELLEQSGIRILHDPIHGASAGLPGRAVPETDVTTVRGEVNPGFGGVNPEPIPSNLDASMETMRSGEFDLAICNDGDADRLGILDESGRFVTPHQILTLLALDLVRRKRKTGEIVKTFSTTRQIERLGRILDVPVVETAIGFKHVVDRMLTHDVLIGGEESGGVGFGDFIPERDGVLSGLMVGECVAANEKPLSTLIAEMEEEMGPSRYGRRDIRTTSEACAAVVESARSGELDGKFGRDFVAREEIDGVKLNYADGTWILFRRSGTEPLIRIYCESATQERVDECLEQAAELMR
ncbi:MAG: phosphoglucomutase/phosphomannomutase family protein [Acidobacteria bacterium]|nr:phosphoglucomutase/phosphomannomutase family protein [Acidobacteriota bacterium]